MVYINPAVYHPQHASGLALESAVSFGLEVVRRWIQALNLEGGFIHQAVFVIDLKGFGIGNFVSMELAARV